MTLTAIQLKKLAELFLDIAKAMFIAAFALPFFATAENIFEFIKLFFIGLVYVILSLQTLNRQGKTI